MEIDLSNYGTNSDLKDSAGVDTFDLAANENLSNSKLRVDKLDIEQLKTNTTHLSNLSNIVEIMLLKALCIAD